MLHAMEDQAVQVVPGSHQRSLALLAFLARRQVMITGVQKSQLDAQTWLGHDQLRLRHVTRVGFDPGPAAVMFL